MNPDQANRIADSLLNQARSSSAPARNATLRRMNAVERLNTGVATLVGAYIGWRFADSWFGHGFPPVVCGLLVGLFAAVVFPRRRQA
ncbi:AtpZ/AtpI family protein [Dyella sp. S184]|jgi:F0F1-type ATP synthase assembly protein I|uniref:AtpZ/AtpI family protein n=1 Tax=Dyella sp. S184 TaxID=1641862 RepID=UPI00131D142B|nr:AtpZ/AtpI family protein [Dyella sp. S184]